MIASARTLRRVNPGVKFNPARGRHDPSTVLDPILFELSLLFGLCVAVALVVHRLRMPPIVGFLVAGVVAGPHGIGLIQHHELVEQLAEVGVVVLLFTVGMELAVGNIARMRRAITVGGSVQVGATIAVGTIVAVSAGLSFGTAVFLGFLLSLSSTAAITKILTDRGQINTPAGRHAVGICVAQDLAVVPMILLIPVLGGGSESVWSAMGGVAKASALLALAAAVAWFLVPRLLDLVARTRSRELFVLSVIAICLSLSVVTAELGLSLALGAFLAGVILGSSDFHHQAVSEVEPFRDTLASLFFLSIGMLFDSSVLLEAPLLITVSVLTVIAGKAVIASLAMRVLRLPSRTCWRVGLSVAQIGEFGFVLTQVAADTNLLGDRLERVFMFVAVVSIAATPLLFALGRMIERRGEPEHRRAREAGEGVSDHVVIVGFGPVGRALADALEAAEVPYRVVEMNSETVKNERARGRPIILGDATRPVVMHALGLERARLVVVAINDPAATKRVAALARRMAKHVHIIARATFLGEVADLEALEVDEVVPQELETSVEIVVRSLRHLLVPDDEVDLRVEQVRERARTGGKQP